MKNMINLEKVSTNNFDIFKVKKSKYLISKIVNILDFYATVFAVAYLLNSFKIFIYEDQLQMLKSVEFNGFIFICIIVVQLFLFIKFMLDKKPLIYYFVTFLFINTIFSPINKVSFFSESIISMITFIM